MKVTFVLPRDTKPVILGAEVVYTRSVDGRYQHGLNFNILDEKTRARIQAYVKAVEEEGGPAPV